MFTILATWLVAMHGGEAHTGQLGGTLTLLALGVAVLVGGLMVVLQRRRSGHGTP